MKNKKLLTALAILLSLACTASLVACDRSNASSETQDTEEHITTQTTTEKVTEEMTEAEAPKTTVTSDEWVKAFDLSALKSFTIAYTEEYYRTIRDPMGDVVPNPDMEAVTVAPSDHENADENATPAIASGEENVITIEVTGTILYQSGNIMAELTKKENDAATDPIKMYAPITVKTLKDIDTFVDGNFPDDFCFSSGQALEELYGQTEDYGFSNFEYSAETMSYTDTATIQDFDVTMELWFENGHLKALKCVTPGGTINLQLSSVNTTEVPLLLTNEQITATIDSAKENILTASACCMKGEVRLPLLGSMPIEEDADVTAPHDFLNGLKIGDMMNYTEYQGALSSVKLNVETSEYNISAGIFDNAISYNYVRLTFDNSGRITSVEIGETFQYKIIY